MSETCVHYVIAEYLRLDMGKIGFCCNCGTELEILTAAELKTLRAKAALADEVASELRAREAMSAVDALMFPRLTDYEEDLLRRYDALSTTEKATQTEEES